MKYKIKKKELKGVPVLVFSGELESRETIDLPSKLFSYTKKHFGPIVIDLQDVTFIDSQWLAVFIRFIERSDEQGNDPCFLTRDGAVRELFDSTNLVKICHMIDSVEEILPE